MVNFSKTVHINQYKVKVLVDTGASVNIINKKTFDQLINTSRTQIHLTKTKTKVLPYGANQPNLKVIGEFSALVETSTKMTSTTILVLETSHKNLLSG